MVVRTLTPEEFPLLKDFPGGFIPNPKSSVAIVGFDGDKPISRMLVLTMVHLEGTFVDEAYRKGSIGFRMLKKAEEQVQDAGLTTLMAYVADDTTAGYLERVGYHKLPVAVWSKEFPCHLQR